MKKVLCLVLSFVLLLGVFAGCANKPSDKGAQDAPSGTPTEQEAELLQSYASILTALEVYATGLSTSDTGDDKAIEFYCTDENGNTATLRGSEALAQYYAKLQEMEAIDKWLTTEEYLVEQYGVPEEIFCDRQTLLSRFSAVSDVLLSQRFVYTDALDNQQTATTLFGYDANGRIIWVDTSPYTSSDAPWHHGDGLLAYLAWLGYGIHPAVSYDFGLIASYGSNGELNKLTNVSHFSDAMVPSSTVLESTDFIYDAQGRLTQTKATQSGTQIDYIYSESSAQANLSYDRTYNLSFGKNGKITKEQLLDPNYKNAERQCVTYTYDGYGDLQTVVYTYVYGNGNSQATATFTYNFTYDAQGVIASVAADYGDNGTILNPWGDTNPGRDCHKTANVEYVYGDYFFFA